MTPHSKKFILPLLLYHESLLLLLQHLVQMSSVFLTINVAIPPPQTLPCRLLPLARTCYEVGDHTKTVRVVREFLQGGMEDSRWITVGRKTSKL